MRPMQPGHAGLVATGLRVADGLGTGSLAGAAWVDDESEPASCPQGLKRMVRLVATKLLQVRGGGTGGEDGEGLGPEKLAPRGSDPPGRRPQAAPAQHVRDRGGGDGDRELHELAFDPEVPPPGVLPSHEKDQPAKGRIDGGTSGAAARPSVLPALELPAPALESVGDDRERATAAGEGTDSPRQRRPGRRGRSG